MVSQYLARKFIGLSELKPNISIHFVSIMRQITYLDIELIIENIKTVNTTLFHSFFGVLSPLHHSNCEYSLALPFYDPRFT